MDSLNKTIFLTSTDTAIGFLSKNASSLDKAKKRAKGKKYITALPSLKNLTKRVPTKHKNLIRRSKKTTFIIDKNFSFRVVKDKNHNLLLKRLGWVYTSSANKSGKEYDFNYAYKKADIIIYPLKNSSASTIYRLGKTKIKKVR